MHDIKALQNKVLNELINIYSRYKESISFDDIILAFFEVSLIIFADQKRLISNGVDICEKKEELYTKFSSFLCSELLNGNWEKSASLEKIVKLLEEFVCEIIKGFGYEVNDIGGLFEFLINIEINEDKINESIDRSDNGMYFSDARLVENTLRLLLQNISKKQLLYKTFIDPAMGAGVFIFELLELVRDKVNKAEFVAFTRNNVYGMDKNPIIVDIFKIIVYIKYLSKEDDISFLCEHFKTGDSLLIPIEGRECSWESMFPIIFNEGGFDYVIGNPPWGKIKSNVREYHLLNGALTKEYQGSELKKRIAQDLDQYKKWEDYQLYIKAYSQKLKALSEYKNQQYVVDNRKTGGDADLYKYFLELSFNLIKEKGGIGYIIPASFYMSEGATGLRHLLLENGTIKYLINFENKKHIFSIHPSFKFIVLIYSKTMKAGVVKKACFDLTNLDDISKENYANLQFVSYDRNFLKRCSGEYWAIPECKNNYEREILEQLYREHSVLGKKNRNKWEVSFNREFDMTLDSNLFVTKEQIDDKYKYYPLYEGRMVNQFNSSKKCYIKGTGRTAEWKNNEKCNIGIINSQYYLKEEDCKNINKRFRAAYCEITGQKNVRTVLASLINPNAVCGNKVPTCTFSPCDSIEYHLYWLAVANSFIVDWIIRKKITITLNFYHWQQTPFPRVSENEAVFKKIVAWSVLAIEKINGYTLTSKIHDNQILQLIKSNASMTYEQLRLEIDIAVATLFNVSSNQMLCILYGFPSLDSKNKAIKGDKKYNTDRKSSYTTRDKLIYEMRIREGLPIDVSIVDLYDSIGIDVKEFTGEIIRLNERIDFYKKFGCYAYNE